ncbi:MAG: hypothetical protein Q8N26_08635 [Myxococcales bacterium]|nr:hypothetical protein [Myxococcales bacterium]
MSLLVHYRCPHCGASREGSSEAGWVRCQHCAAVIGFDFQAWLASPRYAAFLREASKPETMASWATYQRLTTQAAEEGARGLATMEQAADLMLTLLPVSAPDEVSTNPTYRATWRRFLAFSLLQQQVDPSLRALSAALQRRLGALDFRSPLPTLEFAIENLTQQSARLAELEPPDDPDGLSWPVRLRVSLSQFLTAYLPWLSEDAQRVVLERIYGKDALEDTGGADVLGMYLDWSCPACGLASLQARAVTEYTCPGCMFRAPIAHDGASLPELAVRCARCGGPITLGRGERERACSHCQTWHRRMDVTGEVERDFANEVKRQIASKHGLVIDALPRDGTPGLVVTPQTRRALQLTGLARIAAWYGALVPASRVRRLVERTLGPLSPSLLSELEATAREDGHDAARPVFAELAKAFTGRR